MDFYNQVELGSTYPLYKSTTALWLKWLLGRQPALGGHSRDTRRALTFHLGHSRVTCVSLQLHLSFTCSSLIHTSFTCGSLGQQSVQWMLHNWLIRAWKRASSEHSPVLWFSAKALPFFVTSVSLKKTLSPYRVSMKTLIVHYLWLLSTSEPLTEPVRHALGLFLFTQWFLSSW